MGQNSWRAMMLGHGDKKSVLLKTKELHGGGVKRIVKSKSSVKFEKWRVFNDLVF